MGSFKRSFEVFELVDAERGPVSSLFPLRRIVNARVVIVVVDIFIGNVVCRPAHTQTHPVSVVQWLTAVLDIRPGTNLTTGTVFITRTTVIYGLGYGLHTIIALHSAFRPLGDGRTNNNNN